jgi:hypothetical protein
VPDLLVDDVQRVVADEPVHVGDAAADAVLHRQQAVVDLAAQQRLAHFLEGAVAGEVALRPGAVGQQMGGRQGAVGAGKALEAAADQAAVAPALDQGFLHAPGLVEDLLEHSAGEGRRQALRLGILDPAGLDPAFPVAVQQGLALLGALDRPHPPDRVEAPGQDLDELTVGFVDLFADGVERIEGDLGAWAGIHGDVSGCGSVSRLGNPDGCEKPVPR